MMGIADRDYPVVEVALAINDTNPQLGGTRERKMAGDIIGVRRELGMVGTGELSDYFWVRIKGFDIRSLMKLSQWNMEPLLKEDENYGDFDIPPPIYDKRQHCIPFPRLKALNPFLDLSRVQDPADKYQPFLPIDFDTLETLPGPKRNALWVWGLVFDKAKGRFF